jgi:acyl transferase domain-containing protein
LDQIAYAQPALFAIEYALATLWRSWGIEPAAVLGHSVGEYAAAHVAGMFNLEDALKLVAARGRLMQSLPSEGEMVTVFADEATVAAAIAPYAAEVSIAAVNSPETVDFGPPRSHAAGSCRIEGCKGTRAPAAHRPGVSLTAGRANPGYL